MLDSATTLKRYCKGTYFNNKRLSYQTYDDSMEQNTQLMSLHANKRIMLNKRNLCRAKTLDHPSHKLKSLNTEQTSL